MGYTRFRCSTLILKSFIDDAQQPFQIIFVDAKVLLQWTDLLCLKEPDAV